LRNHPPGRKLGMDAGMDIPCDICILAVRPAVIQADNLARPQTRLVAHGATFPCSMEAEQAPAARGLLLLPDFIRQCRRVLTITLPKTAGAQKPTQKIEVTSS
jgi:glutamate dehydrogenase/leucine dehydrogenase